MLNLFCAHRTTLSQDDVDIGQALCDIATIGLLHERFVRERDLLAEQPQNALNSRVLIEQAKGVLAERAGIDVTAAFESCAHASAATRRLSDVATAVIDNTLPTSTLLLRAQLVTPHHRHRRRSALQAYSWAGG
ncbi:ANTAR domain-containing protein [Tenggerimyces flavus]|uniref:ANTAR domain-containing protein n=1 Tax=Tenggerimyces flavus TaxID=1708749 RepID=A0ABV7YB44_9ACTN|nr:ANTAR domain-containing protein [Tenggerimyces flavus]MBM7790280.1 hypothetical protein [Tenggerimyces flavus]